MYVIVDTEGSGLFDFKQPADAPGQPRIAELVLIFADADLNVEREYQAYIRPDGWDMSPDATAVNKLTTEFLLENGRPIAEVLEVYSMAIRQGRIVVAHNAQHDCKQLRAELRRAGVDDLFEQTKNICTMRGCMGHVKKRNGKGGWPGLADACAHFEIDQGGQHTALGDALACLEVLRNLKRLGVCPEAQVHYAKNPPAQREAAA